MITYQILIEYVGTKFVGWQKQKKGISIQSVLEKVLKKLTKKKITVYGSGRTDAGVHAISQSAHFLLDFEIKNKLAFLKSLNFFLTKYNISILNIIKRNKKFHSRHSAKKRIYKYIIINRQSELSLEKNRAWFLRRKLNLNLMKKGTKILKNIKDFSTFRASSCSAKSPIRTLDEVKLKKRKNTIEITFISKSFLQTQVRSMVGCLKFLGEKKWNLKKFKSVALSKKRSNCAPPAPAHGLYLVNVKY